MFLFFYVFGFCSLILCFEETRSFWDSSSLKDYIETYIINDMSELKYGLIDFDKYIEDQNDIKMINDRLKNIYEKYNVSIILILINKLINNSLGFYQITLHSLLNYFKNKNAFIYLAGMEDEINYFKFGSNLKEIFPEYSLDGILYNKIPFIKEKEYKKLLEKILDDLENILQINYEEIINNNNNLNNNETINKLNKNNIKNIKEKKYHIIFLIIILILLILLTFFIYSFKKYKSRVEIISEKGTKYINLISKKI